MTRFTYLLACLAVHLTYSSIALGEEESLAVKHTFVAIEEGRFHGWPANNGVWQWGDEILVGFTQGDFEIKRGHNIAGRQDSLLARSEDGELTWKMFDPQGYLDDDHPQYLGGGKTELNEPLDFSHPGFALRIFAHGYHGNHDPSGGFFYSKNRGADWSGPFALTGLMNHPEMKSKLLSPRTDYLVQGPNHCFIFVSAHDDDERLKRIACIETTDGGKTFHFVTWVTPQSDEASAIMSQTVQLSENDFVLAYRKIYRGDEKRDEIEVYQSRDRCQTWQPISTVKVMQVHSNPPALLKLTDGRVCCVYGERHAGEIRGRYSDDQGTTWGPEFIIRDDFQAMANDPDSKSGINADIGYPRLVQRTDGKLVAIYYWATAENPQQHIAASIWQP